MQSDEANFDYLDFIFFHLGVFDRLSTRIIVDSSLHDMAVGIV